MKRRGRRNQKLEHRQIMELIKTSKDEDDENETIWMRIVKGLEKKERE